MVSTANSHVSEVSGSALPPQNGDRFQSPELLVPSEAKPLARTLRYLRDDMKLAYPRLPTPSSWMIHCLALSYLKHQVEGSAYRQSDSHQQRLIDFLKTISLVAASKSTAISLVEPDGSTPLFPNTDGYTVSQLQVFADLALGYIGVPS